MASSRDDFIIAIRSAFLKKSTQQKFSLLTLVFISIFIIVLSSLDFKAVRYLKAGLRPAREICAFGRNRPLEILLTDFLDPPGTNLARPLQTSALRASYWHFLPSARAFCSSGDYSTPDSSFRVAF